MFFWAKKRVVILRFIQPGRPNHSAFVESFNRNLPEYCLDLNWFAGIDEAQSTINARKTHSNHVRANRSLDGKTPAVLQQKLPDMLKLPHQSWLSFRGAVM